MSEAWQALGRGDVWGALERALGAALAGFYAVFHVYGIAIILLTVAVRLLVWPLTSKQARSMLAMQRVQPEIKKLQQKYKGDRQRLNEEMMKFYQEKGINPLSGCLPLVVQMPILFALFRVFAAPRGSNHFLDVVATRATGGAGPTCGGAIPNGIHALIPSTSALRKALDCGTQSFLGMDLAKRPADFLHQWPNFIPYLLLLAVVVVTGVYSQRQMQKRTPASAQNQQMQMVGKIMPIFFGFITYTLSAGLGIYFAVSNLWQIGQQAMIFRQQQQDEAKEKERERERRKAPVTVGAKSDVAASGGTSGGKLRLKASPATDIEVSGNGETPAENAPTPRDAASPTRRLPGGSRPAEAQRSRKKRKKKGR